MQSFHSIVVWALLEGAGAPPSPALGSVLCSLCSFSVPDVPKHHFHGEAAAGETPRLVLHAPPAALGILCCAKRGMRRSRASCVPPGAASRCFLLACSLLWDGGISLSSILGGCELMVHPVFHGSSSGMGSSHF